MVERLRVDPALAAEFRPRRTRRPGQCTGVFAREHRVDELTVMIREQLFRQRLCLEPEAVSADRRPHRAQRIEQCEPRDPFRPVDRELEADDPAPVVRDDRGAFDTECIHEVDDVLREQLSRAADTRLIRAAIASRIRCKTRISRGEMLELMAPLV